MMQQLHRAQAGASRSMVRTSPAQQRKASVACRATAVAAKSVSGTMADLKARGK